MQDVIFNGPETWIVTSENGQTRAMHIIGTTWNKPADEPSARGSLADVLSSYTERQCVAARLEGSDAVAGQGAYTIVVMPSTAACGACLAASPEPDAPRARVSGQLTSGRVEDIARPVIRVWVDKQSFLPLKLEVRDGSGALVRRSEVTSTQYYVAIPDSTFTYAAPARVTVATFNGGEGTDVERALSAAQENTPPAKAP
jgi:hypothetical protein